MQLNSFNDLVASVNAYLSLLEHHMVLALPFQGLDPSKHSLEKFIGFRWGDKYGQVFDLTRKDDKRYHDRLVEVVVGLVQYLFSRVRRVTPLRCTFTMKGLGPSAWG